jgi:hypothetical protein
LAGALSDRLDIYSVAVGARKRGDAKKSCACDENGHLRARRAGDRIKSVILTDA